MKNFGTRLRQAGISLLEVLLSLAIISIILVMAMQYFTTAGNNQKLNMVRTFVGADMAAIQGYLINNNSTVTDLSWNALVNNGYLSKDTKSLSCTSGTCTQITPWGNQVTLNAKTTEVTLTIPLPNAALCGNLQQSYGTDMVTCSTTDGTATVYINGNKSAA